MWILIHWMKDCLSKPKWKELERNKIETEWGREWLTTRECWKSEKWVFPKNRNPTPDRQQIRHNCIDRTNPSTEKQTCPERRIKKFEIYGRYAENSKIFLPEYNREKKFHLYSYNVTGLFIYKDSTLNITEGSVASNEKWNPPRKIIRPWHSG